MRPKPTRSSALVGLCVLVSAGLVFAGCFLRWFDVTGQGTDTRLKGTDFSVGEGMAVFAVLVAIFALVMLLRARRTGGRAWAITALIFAALIFVLAAGAALSPETALPMWAAENVARALGIPEYTAKTVIEEAFRSGAYEATADIGAYLAFAGSALAVAGSILGIAWAKRFKRVSIPTSPDAGAMASMLPAPPPRLPPPPGMPA